MAAPTDASIKSYVDERVLVVTADGRCYAGTLKAFDQATNLVLESAEERVFSTEEGVQVQPIGLCVIRGDQIVSVGEIDRDLDSQLEFDRIRAPPLKSCHA